MVMTSAETDDERDLDGLFLRRRTMKKSAVSLNHPPTPHQQEPKGRKTQAQTARPSRNGALVSGCMAEIQ